MKIHGTGIVRGLWVTFKHFITTYIEDLRRGPRFYNTPAGIEKRRSSDTTGIFTVQYPEEKLPVPEEFRYMPFLVYDENTDGSRAVRCTACGICSKVCPPQCISIVRSSDPVTGKPVASPAEFYIDVDICMNCGFCAEFCPFDAIRMDHDYEVASVDRIAHHIFDLNRLLKPASYYASIRPTNAAREDEARAAKAAAKKNGAETAA